MFLAMCLALALCVPALADTEGADMTGKKVGFSPVMMSSEFFAGMADDMDAYFSANGMVFSTADANGDVQTQIQNIENFVQMDMDYAERCIAITLDTMSEYFPE